MLTYKDLEKGKKYTIVAGPVPTFINKPITCVYCVDYGAIFISNDTVFNGFGVSRQYPGNYEVILVNDAYRFEEAIDIKDKRWITRQLIAMI